MPWRWCLFCLNSFLCAFPHKEVRCTNKTEIKDGLQYTNKKLSLLGYNNNILYTWGFNNELETVHFVNRSVFLKLCLLEDCLSLLYERSMLLRFHIAELFFYMHMQYVFSENS